jgi:hypothetical protein
VNALANPKVGEYIQKHFVSSFQKVATFQIVNGAKQGGNVAAYFCAPDGRVLHCVAGPVDAEQMLREARWVVETVKSALARSKESGESFKAIFRKEHADRLRREHGLVVEAATFDLPPAAQDDGPLTYRDPSGQPLVPVLPPPPIDGPDVSFKEEEMAKRQASERQAAGARPLMDKAGRRWVLGNQGRVHQIMAAYSLVKLERLYGTVFENILGEKVTTKPVITIGGRHGRGGGVEPAGPCREVCLHCESKAHAGE